MQIPERPILERPALKFHAYKDRSQVLEGRKCRTRILSFGAACVLLSTSGTVLADEIPATQLFARNCAGCHAGGGNIVQRNAGLGLEELKRNNAASPEQIYDLVYSGKGKMPGYGVNCAPKGKCTFAARLADDQIKVLTDYVLEQAAKGWKQ